MSGEKWNLVDDLLDELENGPNLKMNPLGIAVIKSDLARLREENAKLLEEVNLKNQWEHDRINELARLSALVEEAAGIIEHYYHPAMQKSDISIAMQDWLRMAGEGKGTPAPTIINQSGLKPLGTTGKYVDQCEGDIMDDTWFRPGTTTYNGEWTDKNGKVHCIIRVTCNGCGEKLGETHFGCCGHGSSGWMQSLAHKCRDAEGVK
jgi:hypothetical protein